MKRLSLIWIYFTSLRAHFFVVWMMFLLSSCLEPVDLNEVALEDILVVDAMITDQEITQRVILSRTVSLTNPHTDNPETGAQVSLIEDDELVITFEEVEPGSYESKERYGAKKGHNYHLSIVTADGEHYLSDPSTIIATPPIDTVYAEFEPFRSPTNAYAGYFNFYCDLKQNSANHRYFRWIWEATHQVQVSTPSRWKWLGGDDFLLIESGSENDSLQVEFCWTTQTSKTIDVIELLAGESHIVNHPITRFHSDSGYMKIRYSLLVKQYAISEDSYRYWNLIKESGSGGFLFDTQVGTIQGNVRNAKSSETVLGYFEVVEEKSVRQFYVPANFHKDLYYEVSYFAKDCSGDEPIIIERSEVPAYYAEHGFYYDLAYFVGFDPSFAVFLRKECTSCLLYGDTNQKPDFW